MRIKTITTTYNQDEDRLHFAVVDGNGEHRVLWLTRRLAERLVLALIQGLVTPVPEDGPAQDPQAAAAQSLAAQEYAQLEARISQKQLPPVEPGPEAPQGLVHEITLKNADQGVRAIEFHCHGQGPCELWLNSKELRQWLNVVRAAFGAAQWRDDVWPDWVAAPPAGTVG